MRAHVIKRSPTGSCASLRRGARPPRVTGRCQISHAPKSFLLPPDCMFPTDTPGACSSQTLLSIGELTGLLQLCIAVLHETKPDDEA